MRLGMRPTKHSRAYAKRFACPECGAAAHEPCWRVNTRGERYQGTRLHAERMRQAKERWPT